MSDTTTLNAINNYLGNDRLKVHKSSDRWYVTVSSGWADVEISKPTLREALQVAVDYLKQRA